MSKSNNPDTSELNPQSSGNELDCAVSDSSTADSIALEKGTQSPASQRDYLQLMLVQLRRVEDLEQENRKLLAERDVINEKYQEQLRIVEALRSKNVLHGTGDQGSRSDQLLSNQRLSKNPGNQSNKSVSQRQAFDELPAIDAAEFQPLRDQTADSGLSQSYKVVANTTVALGNSVKSSASWCGKKVVAILT